MARGKTRKVVRKATKPQVRQSGSKPRSLPPARQSIAGAADVEMRISVVYDWILEGQPSHRIVKMAGEAWNIRESAARNYITKATELLRQDAAERRSASLDEHLTARWHCYRRAHESGDTKTAAMILKDIGRLQCLYASDRSLLARAGLDESLKEQLEFADSAAADILRQAYQPGGDKTDD